MTTTDSKQFKVTTITIATEQTVMEDGTDGEVTARCYSGDLDEGARITETESHDYILIERVDFGAFAGNWLLMIGTDEWHSEELEYLEAILADWMKDEGCELPMDMATTHADWEGF